MKSKKKKVMVISFAIGAFLFAGTALADIVNKSGYDQLKDTIKLTAENCSEKFDSFTLDISMEMKGDGQRMVSENVVTKYDAANSSMEETSKSENILNRNPNITSYYYSDRKTDIRKSSLEETYYVVTKDEGIETTRFNNPFEEERAEDMEKILDALVGNLKDHVVVKENPDGGKELSGALTDVQIPALINAVASFVIKRDFNMEKSGMDTWTKDIYLKEVRGNASVNPEGILESIMGTIIASGVDEKGKVHELSFEVLVKIKDINATAVVKPDLKGKKVVEKKATSGREQTEFNPDQFVGQYKNDMIMEKDGKFIKVGERILDITQIDQNTVQASYQEAFKEDFAEYATDYSELTIQAKLDKDAHNNATFETTNKAGNKISGTMAFDNYMGKVYFYFNVPAGGPVVEDSSFSPVLD